MDEIAGLMLYSEHQSVPTDSVGYWSSTYNGVSLWRSGLPYSAISDKQKDFLLNDNLRAVLVVRVESPRISAEWNNNLQAFFAVVRAGLWADAESTDSFPDDFYFEGSRTAAFTQIGNAVPPLMALSPVSDSSSLVPQMASYTWAERPAISLWSWPSPPPGTAVITTRM